jgi:hypothetical protein
MPWEKNKYDALIGLHAISSCDVTGRIRGKSKPAWWDVFTKVDNDSNIIHAVMDLGNKK